MISIEPFSIVWLERITMFIFRRCTSEDSVFRLPDVAQSIGLKSSIFKLCLYGMRSAILRRRRNQRQLWRKRPSIPASHDRGSFSVEDGRRESRPPGAWSSVRISLSRPSAGTCAPIGVHCRRRLPAARRTVYQLPSSRLCPTTSGPVERSSRSMANCSGFLCFDCKCDKPHLRT